MSLSLFYISLQFFRLNRCNSIYNIIKGVLIALVTYLIFFIGWKLTAQVIDPLCLLNSTDFYPFFILGYFTSKYNWIEYLKYSQLDIHYGIGRLFDRHFPIHIVDSISERFIVRLCAIVVITMLFAEREKEYSVVEHTLAYIGRNTLDIYVLHYFFVNSINLVVDKWIQSIDNTPLSFVVTLLLAIPSLISL